MNRPRTESNLPDLTRALKVHRWLFAAVVLAAILGSIGYSLAQEKRYTAEAAVVFRDESQELGQLGLPIAPAQTASERAASHAQTIVGAEVMSRVQEELDSPLSLAGLTAQVSATVDPSSTFVRVSAETPSAAGAEELANALATEGAEFVNEKTRDAFKDQARELKRQLPPKSDSLARAEVQENISRLLTLSKVTTPAEVTAVAERPTSPTSPKPVRNGLLGALLGLVVGLIAVLVRDTFDRRLRRASDISAEMGIPLLGCVDNDVLGRSARPGGDNKVTGPDWELFRILRRLLDFVGGGGGGSRVVAVSSAVPEEGKTTVASFLAFASAAAGDRTLLIECDLRRPAIGERLDLSRSPGLSDYVMGRAQPADVIQTVSFDYLPAAEAESGNGAWAETAGPHTHRLACITAGTAVHDPVEVFRSPRFREMLAAVRDAYDVVLLDTPPMLVVVDPLELLPLADTVVMCVRATQATRDQVRAGKEALARLPDRPTGLVVTGVEAGAEPGYEHYGYY